MAIRNLNPGIRTQIPDLMGGSANSLNLTYPDPQRPQTNWLRAAYASTGVRTTYVIPGDWPGKPDDWYASDATTYPLRKQNNVEYLVDGEATFEAMVEAIETATGPDHFIVLVGWACHAEDFNLSEKGKRTPGAMRTFKSIIEERLTLGVLVRVLLYYNVADPDFWGTSEEVNTKKALDKLEPRKPPRPTPAKIRCLLDNCIKERVYVFGKTAIARSSHHQKILLVYGSEGLIGFYGGVDINGDRVQAGNVRIAGGPALVDAHGPLHDVHARVWGEAAGDLMVLATNRWNFSIPHDGTPEIEDDGKGSSVEVKYKKGRDMEDMNLLLARTRGKATAPPGPHHCVKIAQTVGNPDLAKLQDSGAWLMVKHAIRQAKKFIYMEDQYLWSVDAAEELGRAAARLAHITILIPPDDIVGVRIRRRALKHMKEAAGASADKIRIYVVRDTRHQYIHTKMFIFDDEYVLLGSPNCNNRGYITDSEVNGGIADPEWQSKAGPRGGNWWALELNLAHRLRLHLWAEHLGNPPLDYLIDGVASEYYWRFSHNNPGYRPRITPYTVKLDDGGYRLWHEYPYKDSDDDIMYDLVLIDPAIR